MNRISKSGKFAELVRQSLILTLLFRFADYLRESAMRSVIGSLLTSYRAERDNTEQTAAYALLNRKRFSVKNRILLPGKRFFNQSFSRSLLLFFVRKTMRQLFDLPVRFYGTVLFSYGIYTIAIDLIFLYGFELELISAPNTLTGMLIAIIAFPLLFPIKPLSEALGGSAIAHFLICRVLGYSEQSLRAKSTPRGKTAAAMILGILLSLISGRISILRILSFLLIAIIGYLILLTPETGVILIFATIPFLTTMQVSALVLITILSFCLKLMQGKRSLSLEVIDYAVFGFLLFVLVGGLVSLSPQDSIRPALLQCCLLGTYFLVISTVRTTAIVKRCIYMLLFSASVEGILCVAEWCFGNLSTKWQDLSLFSDISGRIVGTFANPNVLGEYLILTLPFLFALLGLCRSIAARLGVLLLIGISGAALIFTWSRGAWLGMLVGIIVFALMTRKRMSLILLGITVSLPSLSLLLPSTVLHRLLSIGNLADTSIAYRINIWKGSLDMAKHFLIGGIGTGVDTYQALYPYYALDGIEAAPHSHNLYLQILIEHGLGALVLFLCIIFLFLQSGFTFLCASTAPADRSMRLFTAAGMAAIPAFLVQGMTDYVWYNYRIFGFFWMLLALIGAIRRASVREQTLCIPDDTYVKSNRKADFT